LRHGNEVQAQEEYRRRQDAMRRQQQSGQGGGEAVSLDALEFIPYLTEEGYITDPTQPGVKASLYGIFDENKTLCYIGVSRQVCNLFVNSCLVLFLLEYSRIMKRIRSLISVVLLS
jgi:hypothetical protein